MRERRRDVELIFFIQYNIRDRGEEFGIRSLHDGGSG
jgi:hypothetical protein